MPMRDWLLVRKKSQMVPASLRVFLLVVSSIYLHDSFFSCRARGTIRYHAQEPYTLRFGCISYRSTVFGHKIDRLFPGLKSINRLACRLNFHDVFE